LVARGWSGNWILGGYAAGILMVTGVLMQQSLLRPLQNDIPSLRAGVIIVAAMGLAVFYTLARFGDMSPFRLRLRAWPSPS
jgi:hypothetical protein